MFENSIVRKPSKEIINGITSNPQLGKPNYEKALKQHEFYVKTLKECGVRVEILEADDRFPDSCFVEDVAVCTKKFVMITNPGAYSRKGEEKEIIKTLKNYYIDIDFINPPGTLEGGDVMMVGDHYYIGLSERTNEEGANQLINALKKRGMSGSVIQMKEMLHLKTGMSYLEDNIILLTGEFVNKAEFNNFNKIIIEKKDEYSANCIRVNDFVIIPAGFEETKRKIENAGLKTKVVDTSEFMKIDGGLSCLSLRF